MFCKAVRFGKTTRRGTLAYARIAEGRSVVGDEVMLKKVVRV